MSFWIITALFLICGQGIHSQIISERGCSCKDEWNLYGVVYFGCQNPDNDPNGSWCIVQTQICPRGKPGEIQSQGQGSGQFFDYCTPPASSNGEQEQIQVQEPQQQSPQEDLQLSVARSSIIFDQPSTPYEVIDRDQPSETNLVQSTPTPIPIPITFSQVPTLNIFVDQLSDEQECVQKTIGGCECMVEWQVDGNKYIGCQNLDNDPRGSWCMVKNGNSCSQGGPTKFLSLASQGIFDYCDASSDCFQDVQSEAGTVSSQLDPPPEFEGACKETKSGCKCLSEWTYDGDVDGAKVAYYGCAKTLDDQSDPWCPVDTSFICVTEPHSAQLGGNYSSWDYCQPQCEPPTQGSCTRTREGCDCLEFWNYDGKVQQGCTRPDLDASVWCVVDPESCTGSVGPTGQLPTTQEFWDFCDSSCT